MSTHKILITGANGQVGSSLKSVLQNENIQCHFVDQEDFDLTNNEQMHDVLTKVNPSIIINTAAYTQVDNAESDESLAAIVNSNACEFLAKYCQKNEALLIHFSTDYVYHNQENRPLREGDARNPQSVYARTKADGENLIRNNCSKYFILRTSWVYNADGKNFVRTMLALSSKYPELTVVDDQIGSPTYAPDLAKVAAEAVGRFIDGKMIDTDYGIYNVSNEGVCSWYDFAKAIFEIRNIDISVRPVPSTAFPRPAARPHYSVMDKSKIRSFLGDDYRIPHWRSSLDSCLALIPEDLD